MFARATDSTKALAYYSIAFALALMVAATGATAAYMFAPLAAVLVTLLVVTRDGYSRAGWATLGLHRAGWRAWPAALLVPLAVMAIAYGALWAAGALDFTTTGVIFGNRVPLALAPLGVFLSIFTQSLARSLGEEIGWRGYLLPRLRALGPWRAAGLSGFLHAVWHLPLILLTPDYHAAGNRLIVIPLFLATLTIAGAFFAYLRLVTDSVWPASVAHSAHNVLMNAFPGFAIFASPLANEYLAGDSGLLVALGYAALGGWLLYGLTTRPRARQLRAAAEPA